MSFAQRVTIPVTTDGSGAATVYSEAVTGKVSQIRYVKTDFADGSTITFTNETTGETIWAESTVNASATRAPRQATHSTAGVAATLDGTRPALDKIALANDRIKLVIAGGGATKSGTFYIMLE